ncbi:MAG: hypothetical protein IPG82_21095 [Saprospiraceae bacterium]|nr:hypothetical protein [Saprospiraceae bacterium]
MQQISIPREHRDISRIYVVNDSQSIQVAASIHSVQSELNHGFSALIDLYKNSIRHIDINGVEWQTADEERKAQMKREAANLIILVDQFEEFFYQS